MFPTEPEPEHEKIISTFGVSAEDGNLTCQWIDGDEQNNMNDTVEAFVEIGVDCDNATASAYPSHHDSALTNDPNRISDAVQNDNASSELAKDFVDIGTQIDNSND